MFTTAPLVTKRLVQLVTCLMLPATTFPTISCKNRTSAGEVFVRVAERAMTPSTSPSVRSGAHRVGNSVWTEPSPVATTTIR